MAKKIKCKVDNDRLEKLIESEIAEQYWLRDYGLDDMGSISAQGYINGLEWVLEKLAEVRTYA